MFMASSVSIMIVGKLGSGASESWNGKNLFCCGKAQR